MSSSSATKVCFNSNCNDVLERSRKGWRRRTGDYADLCDRCASAYEEGKFCETFHLAASGWRCCESCRKQIHCGCIVSFHMFVLLDAGGIECITCARKGFILTPNPAWPTPSHFLPLLPERIKDLSAKSWCQITGSGPVPWRQAPSLFSSSPSHSDLQPKMPFEVDIPTGIDRLIGIERSSASSLEKSKVEDSSERLVNDSLKLGSSEIHDNGNAGINCVEEAKPCGKVPQKSLFSKNDTSTSQFGLAGSASPNADQTKLSGIHAPRPTPPPPIGKHFCGHNGADSSGETQTLNAMPQADARVRNQLLPRYWPRITDQELQKISGDSNSVVTPLFEKMLSASDAGKIGRLVLPKKCAEAYFPAIYHPEGLPLKVQDSKGKEWMFQFRFWPNNNSRMYVLEGITPCIQSMQLQAGDIVTFSRIEAEGKLVMGFRKATTAPPSNQGGENVNTCNGVGMNGEGSVKKTKPEVLSNPRQLKGHSVSPDISSIDQAYSSDPASLWPKSDKSGNAAKEVLGAKSSFHNKRKTSASGSKSKRLRIENEDLIKLKLTWEQAQGLLRPPPNRVPSIVVIDAIEFEEYEDAPIFGRPTIFATDHMGRGILWAQCEDCFKWRKLPADALLPSRWTCSENSWDPERSSCSAAQELTNEQLEDLLPTGNPVDYEKMEVAKQDSEQGEEALEGLDALANLALQEDSETLPASPSSQATTRHPRHRPGCTCIVCIQPPSGKGPKHKQTCACNVCLTVKRRFQTQMLRREKKQSEKEAENARQKQHENQYFPGKLPDDEIELFTNTANSSQNQKMVNCEDRDGMGPSVSPLKSQIDLNMQPEKDEELSPGSDSSGRMRLIQESYKHYLMQLFPSINNRNSPRDQTQLRGLVSSGTNTPPATSSTESSIHEPYKRYPMQLFPNLGNRNSAHDPTQLHGVAPSDTNLPPASSSGAK